MELGILFAIFLLILISLVLIHWWMGLWKRECREQNQHLQALIYDLQEMISNITFDQRSTRDLLAQIDQKFLTFINDSEERERLTNKVIELVSLEKKQQVKDRRRFGND